MTFGEKCKKVRATLLLTQREFAKEIGATYATVARWETGKAIPQYNKQRDFYAFCKKHKIEF